MNPLKSTSWLSENIGKVKILDATWHMPSSELNAFEIFKEKHIPGSIYIDLEEISDPNLADPVTLSSPSNLGALVPITLY